jgi:hypothetical protein
LGEAGSLIGVRAFPVVRRTAPPSQIKIKIDTDQHIFADSELDNLSISSTFYTQLLHAKVQKDTDELTVFLHFWDLHS